MHRFSAAPARRPGRPGALAALVMSFVLLGPAPPGAVAQNVADSFSPFVSARDIREIAYDGETTLWMASSGGALRWNGGCPRGPP